MYHPRFDGSPYEMGRKMGEIFKKSGARFPINLDPFQIRHGIASGKVLKECFPEAAEEIHGVTDVIGIDHDLFTAWMMCMGCCLDLDGGGGVEVRGCTAFSFTQYGRVYYGRNNDLPPFLKAVSKSIYYRPQNGNRFVMNTSSFINGEEGMNEHGLAAAMTFVHPVPDEIRPGLNSVFLVRYVLEKCRTVAEGLRALHELPVASSCNILLTDRSGAMSVAECCPQMIHLRGPVTAKNGEPFVVAVNHITSETMRAHDASERNEFQSAERYRTVTDAFRGTDFTDGVEFAIRLLSGKHGFICRYDQRKVNFDTIWASVFDGCGGRIFRAEGNPSRTQFREDARLR